MDYKKFSENRKVINKVLVAGDLPRLTVPGMSLTVSEILQKELSGVMPNIQTNSLTVDGTMPAYGVELSDVINYGKYSRGTPEQTPGPTPEPTPVPTPEPMSEPGPELEI